MPDAVAAILRKVAESNQVQQAFFQVAAPALAACAEAVAGRLQAGGRLFTFGNGGSACDASHLAVEFVHPVLEKRRAFPAFSLASDPALLTAVGNDSDFALVYAQALRRHLTPQDVAVGFSTSGRSANVTRGLKAARELGALTVAVTGKDGGELPAAAEHCFVVPSWSIHRIQEAHVAWLHLLWDLVHVCLGAEDLV